MIKKTIIYTLIISLILILPWSVKAQGPVNAPFVLKDAFTGEVDLSQIWTEINNLKDRILNIENSQPGAGSGETIKVYDSNDHYLGIFAGRESNYIIFLDKLNKFIRIHPSLLTTTPSETYYDEKCDENSIYSYSNNIDPNELYKIKNNWYYGSPNPEDIITDVYYKTDEGDCLYLGQTTNKYIKMIPSSDFVIPENLQAPLQLRYE